MILRPAPACADVRCPYVLPRCAVAAGPSPHSTRQPPALARSRFVIPIEKRPWPAVSKKQTANGRRRGTLTVLIFRTYIKERYHA